ncbi:MAG: N-acetyltransferase [Chitinophagaceae bacterium]|nr:N-acetyltransferase [Chitinophagaceae bacterium]MCW5905983.1 N-acetyltransferase [Chitinophagaceae bacterium]
MIRLAQKEDLNEINAIYNDAVLAKFETADTEPISIEERLIWFEQHAKPYQIYVYTKNNTVVAWLSFSPYRLGRKAVRFTAEISYYVHKNYQQKGIGSALIEFAIKEAKNLYFNNIFAIVLDKNIASINLLKKYHFMQWGHLPDIANFDGEICGHLYYGLKV